MSFSDFQNIKQVTKNYPLRIRQERFLPDIRLELPALFIDNLNFAIETKAVEESEAFFCENFIYPFLQQTWKQHRKLKVWSHQAIVFDEELNGEPDYLISALTDEVIDTFITKPLLAVAEAKKEDFSKGWAQCLAEMIACQKINDDESIIIYGIVSTGLFWEFGKLTKNIFTKHLLSYSINEPDKLFAILDFIFAECEKQID